VRVQCDKDLNLYRGAINAFDWILGGGADKEIAQILGLDEDPAPPPADYMRTEPYPHHEVDNG